MSRIPFRHTTASVLLDLVRGLAATMVLLSHIHTLLFITSRPPASQPTHPLLLRLIGPFISAANEAVVIFFVLSGFLISRSVLRWMAEGTWSWRRYLTHRLVRLWIVLIPALLLCAFWDTARLAFTSPNLHAHPLVHLASELSTQGSNWHTLLGNMAFLQTIRTPYFGSDHPLWSLAYEFWYYLLFPLGLLILRKQTPPLQRLLYAVLFGAIAWFLGHAVMALFPAWLLGSLLAAARPPHLGAVSRWAVSIAYTLLLFWIVGHEWDHPIFKEAYVLGAATALFLWVLLSAQARTEEHAVFGRLSRGLASFSYSLYLVHYPPLVFAAAVLLKHGLWEIDPRHLLFGAVVTCAMLIYAYAVASVSEFRNDTVRDSIEKHLRLGTVKDDLARAAKMKFTEKPT